MAPLDNMHWLLSATLMDAISAATTFSSLVGLICNFRQERGEREALDHRQFIEWLEYHRHEDLKNLIVNQAALRVEVDNLLRSDVAQLARKMDEMGKILVAILGRLDEFRGLAVAVAPDTGLTDQALSILRQLADSESASVYFANWGNGAWTLQLENGEQIGVTEPRFIEDDLMQLARLGLLAVEPNSQGNLICRLTRNGGRFLQALRQ